MPKLFRVYRCSNCGTLRTRSWEDLCDACGMHVDDCAPVDVGTFLTHPGFTIEWVDDSSTRLHRDA
jgi:hypothetical protein